MPRHLVIEVSVSAHSCTGIQHGAYPSTGHISLELNEISLFAQDGSFEVSEDQVLKILYHEFGHFIDARLDPNFRYDHDRRPPQGPMRVAYYHLWDAYIDGRLGEFAPYTLQERQNEAAKCQAALPEAAIASIWSGPPVSFDEILSLAERYTSPIG